jgi:hypothetical protein
MKAALHIDVPRPPDEVFDFLIDLLPPPGSLDGINHPAAECGSR